ncbi:N-6 DNA methylase [Methanolobus sp. WCC5]|uniref:N-6 DNA methylase n=1 Tax=Methanolobus sp. WCC5 TaxID=3125785 RepID=UPI00324E465E
MSTQLTFDALPVSPLPPAAAQLVEPDFTPRPLATITKDFQDTIRNLSYTRHSWQVWQDFCELAALSLANAIVFSREREDRYMATIERYEPKEVQFFPKLLGMVAEAIEVEFQDFLGQMFMDLEMGNKWRGQFFTPYHLCKAIAQLSLNVDDFTEDKIVTLNEPACGGGAMVIATCECLRDAGICFHDRLRVIAQDVDVTSAHMCFIQLSLIGCQAHVIVGNTLAVECLDRYVTPFAMLKGWLN